MSTSKSTQSARTREFVEITGASSTDAQRFLKASNWRLEQAMDAYFSDPRAQARAGAAGGGGGVSAATGKNLDGLWGKYRDAANPDEVGMDGTMAYCEDLGVSPEDVVMLALAWFTKAPTMGKFAKKPWVEAWAGARADTLERQRDHVAQLRTQLADPDTFRKVYNHAFDYAKQEGQKSMQFEIAQELWNLLIPLDPASSFPAEHLGWWLSFLEEKGAKAVSKDTWNLFLEFVRTIDPAFKQYDEEAAWPSLIDDFVAYARAKL
ncbi:hypothetical protein JCM10207_002077 [Rhodosporidiobolus poonsookiae]